MEEGIPGTIAFWRNLINHSNNHLFQMDLRHVNIENACTMYLIKLKYDIKTKEKRKDICYKLK